MNRRILIGAVLLGFAASATAAPIRVGIYKALGTPNRYWHTNIHPGSLMIAAMLANPANAGLEKPVVPLQGFSVTMYGVDASCDSNACAASSEQKAAFIAALDTLDVAIFMSNTSFGSGFNSTLHRDRLAGYWLTRGVISMHSSIDGFGEWSAWDTLNAARFQNHPKTHMNATLRLDTVGGVPLDPAWKFLNQGLPDTARFVEEWFSFTQNANVIRSRAHLKVLVNIDENSYDLGLDGARAMGADHPMSWYRQFPEGGRFFYTAIGHRTETFDSVYFFRRQLYNAILWASGYDVNTAVRPAESSAHFSNLARMSLSGAALTISTFRDGPHAIEITGLDGRRGDSRTGAGRMDHAFTNLRPGMHLVRVRTGEESHAFKVMVP